MENEILDFESEEKKGSSFRKKLILIESTVFLILILAFNFSQIGGFEFFAFLLIPIVIFYLIFLLIGPFLSYRKKENGGKMALLYFIQNLFLLIFIFGLLLKIESWEGASEMMMFGAVSLIFLFLLPHFQLKKSKALQELHFLSALINLAVLVSFLGLFFKLESRAGGSEITLIGGILCLVMLAISSISFFSNQEKFAPIGFYIPRLLLGFYFTLPSFLYVFN